MLSASIESLGFIKPDLEDMRNHPDNDLWVYRSYDLAEDSIQGMVGELEDTVQNPVNGLGQVYKGHRIKPFTGEFTLVVKAGPRKYGQTSLRRSFLELYDTVQPGKVFIFNVHNAHINTGYAPSQEKFYNATYSARLRATRPIAWPNPDPQDFDHDNVKVIVPVICDDGFWFQTKTISPTLEGGEYKARFYRRSKIPSGFKLMFSLDKGKTANIKGVWRDSGADFLNLTLEAGENAGTHYIEFDLGKAPVVRTVNGKAVKSLTDQLKPQDYAHLQSPTGDVVKFTGNVSYGITYEERHLVPWGGDEG